VCICGFVVSADAGGTGRPTDHTDHSDVTRPVSRCVAIYVSRHQLPRCVVCRPTPLNRDTDINTASESDVTTIRRHAFHRSTTAEHYKLLDPEVSKSVKYIQSGPKRYPCFIFAITSVNVHVSDMTTAQYTACNCLLYARSQNVPCYFTLPYFFR